MNHSAERRQFPIHPRQHVVHGGGIRHIRQFHPHRGPAFTQRVDFFFNLGVRRPSSVQHDRPRTVIRQPAGHGAPDTAQAAGHQVGPVLPQPASHKRWCRHDDLSDMPGRSHESQRSPRFGQWPPAVDKRFQFSRRKALHHFPENPSDTSRLSLLQNIQLQD